MRNWGRRRGKGCRLKVNRDRDDCQLLLPFSVFSVSSVVFFMSLRSWRSLRDAFFDHDHDYYEFLASSSVSSVVSVVKFVVGGSGIGGGAPPAPMRNEGGEKDEG